MPLSSRDIFCDFEDTIGIEDLLDWLRDFKLTVLAHNSQGFDCYLILDNLYQRYIVPDQIVIDWCQDPVPISISGEDIVFKDSPCFFQMPLSSLPTAFELVEEKKGFFTPFLQHARPSVASCVVT